MMEKLLTLLASLRVRLIITYALVTAFSFGLMLLLLVEPVERFLITREEEKLIAVAATIGSTIRSPYDVGPVHSQINFEEDCRWTQARRLPLLQSRGIPLRTRIRILDAKSRTLVDTNYPHPEDWNKWSRFRLTIPSLSDYAEIRSAMAKNYGAATRFADAGVKHPQDYRMYVALPIMRQDKLAFIMYLDQPLSTVQTNLRKVRQIIIYYGMLPGFLTTVLVSILLSSYFSAGLRSAIQIARAFAAGKMDVRMRARGRDELGQLGGAFNQMADALQRQEQLRIDLLADVSHELRTPLTAISGCADTLADGMARNDPEVTERFLSIIHRESKRLQRLVADILELSKFRAGAITIPEQPVPICPLIEDAVEIARLHVSQGDVTINCIYPDCLDEDLVVVGNEDRLAQALRNLLDNARHHTPKGKAITVSTEIHDDTVVIRVRDEGEGIPMEDLPWVFDRFYRAGKGEKVTGGTGLGLAIVREIMLALGGKIDVQSALGQGTTFSLHLRKVQADVLKTSVTDGIR